MVRDGAVGSIGSSRRDQLLDDARKMATLDADQPAVAQLLLHEEVRQMAPRHAREDNLLLHLVIRDGAFVRAFDEEMAFAGGASHGVAQDGLREGAQPRRRERPGRDEREEAGRDDRHHRHGAEVEPFEALVGLVDAMHDEVRFVVEEALPRPRDGFVVELDPRSRVTREEATQQREHPAPWRQVADDDPQARLLPHRDLPRMHVELLRVLQQQSRVLVQRPSGGRGAHAVATAIEQRDLHARLELGDGREDRGVRTVQPFRRGLEPPGLDDGRTTLSP